MQDAKTKSKKQKRKIPADKPLSRSQKKQIAEAVKKAKMQGKIAMSAQQTICYKAMYPDGVCRVTDKFFTKTLQFFDINYQLARNEDKNEIFENYCDFLNYFDHSISVQLSFLNQNVDMEEYQKMIEIPKQEDEFDAIRTEYMQMLKEQIAKGNNGLIKRKFITFGIEADDIKAAKQKLERIEADILGNFKALGVSAKPLSGLERLELLHGSFNEGTNEKFRFNWDLVHKTGLSTKDFIAPTSFDFRDSRTFKCGSNLGQVSFVQIIAPELTDSMLKDFLDLDTPIAVNLHIKSIDQSEAIKMVKRKITDLDKMKIEEQKKAVRSGYDMDIIPSDLATFGVDAKNLLEQLQGRNERMFLITVLVMNTAKNKRALANAVFAAQGIAQKYNCALKPLDFQQEQGLMSSVPIGINQIEIQRGMTTSSTAIFVPFTTQELFQTGNEALYYGLNALSNNMIMVDRKKLKNPNGLILGTPGCLAYDTEIVLKDGVIEKIGSLFDKGVKELDTYSYDEVKKKLVHSKAKDIRIEKQTDELYKIDFSDGTSVSLTDTHLLLCADENYIAAAEIKPGTVLYGGNTVAKVEFVKLDEKINVYDMTVPKYYNFLLANGVVVHNSGKSFSAKREITNCFLVTHDDIIICDPEAEYYPLVSKLNGQVIKIAPNSRNYINPMDINLNYSEEENPVMLKSDFILSLCELIVGGKNGLEPIEKSVIDKAVRNVYRPYLLNPEPSNMPILEDLFNELNSMPELEAKRIASALELYVHGSLNVFNHRTNVDMNNRLICFDIKELGKQLKKIGMLIVQDQVWNRVTLNRAEHKSTRYYIDEFHLLLKEEQTAAYSIEIWKRFRKWGGIPTGITQNVKDLLSSREIENIFENSDFIYMLNQAGGDREILAKQLGISANQLSYVTQSNEGEGLLFYGNVIIPFVDRFPKHLELYRYMTTKPEEVANNE